MIGGYRPISYIPNLTVWICALFSRLVHGVAGPGEFQIRRSTVLFTALDEHKHSALSIRSSGVSHGVVNVRHHLEELSFIDIATSHTDTLTVLREIKGRLRGMTYVVNR